MPQRVHSSNEPGELSQWLCHDDSTINIVLDIIIIFLKLFYYYYYCHQFNHETFGIDRQWL